MIKVLRYKGIDIEDEIARDFILFDNIKRVQASKVLTCIPISKSGYDNYIHSNGIESVRILDVPDEDTACFLDCDVFYPGYENGSYPLEIVFDTMAFICDDSGNTIETIKVTPIAKRKN